MTLTNHINTTEWLRLYSDAERGHLLNFCYNLLMWTERDKADALEITSRAIIWKRAETIVGAFPITAEQPTPTFVEMLRLVIGRDSAVSKYCELIFEDRERAIFRFVMLHE